MSQIDRNKIEDIINVFPSLMDDIIAFQDEDISKVSVCIPILQKDKAFQNHTEVEQSKIFFSLIKLMRSLSHSEYDKWRENSRRILKEREDIIKYYVNLTKDLMKLVKNTEIKKISGYLKKDLTKKHIISKLDLANDYFRQFLKRHQYSFKYFDLFSDEYIIEFIEISQKHGLKKITIENCIWEIWKIWDGSEHHNARSKIEALLRSSNKYDFINFQLSKTCRKHMKFTDTWKSNLQQIELEISQI